MRVLGQQLLVALMRTRSWCCQQQERTIESWFCNVRFAEFQCLLIHDLSCRKLYCIDADKCMQHVVPDQQDFDQRRSMKQS